MTTHQRKKNVIFDLMRTENLSLLNGLILLLGLTFYSINLIENITELNWVRKECWFYQSYKVYSSVLYITYYYYYVKTTSDKCLIKVQLPISYRYGSRIERKTFVESWEKLSKIIRLADKYIGVRENGHLTDRKIDRTAKTVKPTRSIGWPMTEISIRTVDQQVYRRIIDPAKRLTDW